MNNWMDEPAPMDSDDLYRGLRSPRCNGCAYAKLKYELGHRMVVIRDTFINVYELNAQPVAGQSKRHMQYEGHPIRYRAGFLSIEHSDECYHWKPPKTKRTGP